jgi:hypothetical protein
MDKSYAIIDLDGYVTEIRRAAADSIASDNNENLDDYITLDQMKGLVEQWSLGKDDEDRLILNEDANQNIFEDTRIWISNVGLAKLASEDLIECAWDNDSNEMIFWVKEPTEKKNESKPKNKRTKRKNSGS